MFFDVVSAFPAQVLHQHTRPFHISQRHEECFRTPGAEPYVEMMMAEHQQRSAVAGRRSAVTRLGKVTTEISPADMKQIISKDIQSKTWKAVRFSSTFSRGSNTPTYATVSKAVQTASTAYKLRLKRWPSWPSNGVASSIASGGYYHVRSGARTVDHFYHPLWIRRILSFVFSQFGIVLFLASWICGHAALFQHLEQAPDLKLVNDVTASRNELVITLATELRQVFPYEMAWRRKIDDFFTKFENALSNATTRGYSTSRRAFYKWGYVDFVFFALQLVTGQGKVGAGPGHKGL